MYPAAFEYSAPSTLEEAIALLTQHGDDAKLIAGGHSLLPMMKLRFARPAHLVDLRRIAALTGITRAKDHLRVGAMTTYRAIAESVDVQAVLPMLSDATALIGDPQVRNRGTIGGSLAHADPAADLPAIVLAAGAQLVAVGRKGARTIGVDDFFVGMLTTALAADEVLTEVRFPLPGARTGSAYAKCIHPASRFAIVGVAARVTLGADGNVADARIAVTGAGTHAVRAQSAEKSLVGKPPTAENVRASGNGLAQALEPREDALGDAAYKRNLARAYAERAINAAIARASA